MPLLLLRPAVQGLVCPYNFPDKFFPQNNPNMTLDQALDLCRQVRPWDGD